MTLGQRLNTYFWMAAGLVILIWPCLAEDWQLCTSSVNPFGRLPRRIDRWRSEFLQSIYGNPEDGVSGEFALIWNSSDTARVGYMPNAWAPWRAYCWSAWRNSTNMLTRRYGKT
jgi:hypothetical protein